MKTNKKIIIKIVCLILIVVSSILLIVFIKNGDNDNNVIKTEDKTEETSNNSQSILSDEVVNDLKNNLGKGTNGGVVNVEKRLTDKGEDQYIFIYNDGSTQTVTIKDAKEGSGVEDVGSDPKEEKPQKEKEPTHEEEKDDEEEEEQKPQEDLGTVYERYSNMSKYEQYAFYKTFNSQSEFVEWYKAAQAEYLKLHPKIEIGKDQIIDFGS